MSNMPVVGLPSTLESMLNAALEDMCLSSFKIEGRGRQTVITLRLADKISSQPPPVGDSSTSYRRKGPSQLKRDRRRAEEYRTNRDKQASEQLTSPSGLFLPTPPSLVYGDSKNEADYTNNDMFPINDSPPSATLPSPSSQLDTQQIDMKKCDTDTQTVTISFDETTACDETCCADICDVLCETESEGAGDVGASVVSESVKSQKASSVEPGDIGSQILACLQQSAENIDSLHNMIKECKSCTADIVEDLNYHRDVS